MQAILAMVRQKNVRLAAVELNRSAVV